MSVKVPDDSNRVAELKEMERRLEQQRQVAAFNKLRDQRQEGRDRRSVPDYTIHRR